MPFASSSDPQRGRSSRSAHLGGGGPGDGGWLLDIRDMMERDGGMNS
jgi:hypothetical protein